MVLDNKTISSLPGESDDGHDSSSAGTGSSSKNHHSTSTGDSDPSSSTGTMTTKKGGQEFAKTETAYVNRLRYLILLILIIAAIGVSLMVYYVSSNAEEDELVTQFEAASSRLVDAFDAISTDRVATLASLAVAATAHGVDHSRDWPFVSLSFFQQRAYTAKSDSGAIQVSIAPFVANEDRALYESYIVSNEPEVDWIEQAIDYQEEIGIDVFINSYGTSFRGNTSAPHSIKGLDQSPVENQPNGYLPLWQTSPFIGFHFVNNDMSDKNDPRAYYGELCLKEKAIVVGSPISSDPGGINSPNPFTAATAQLLSAFEEREVEYQGDPLSYIFIPIFDSFRNDRVAKAVLNGLFNWGSLFAGVLSESHNGVDVVLRNPCYDPFTFRVNGAVVVPRGKGDLHERSFNDWEVVTDPLQSGTTADGTRDGLQYIIEGCEYTLSIYPSEAFAQSYQSSTPWILVTAVAGVLLFAVAMFFAYDRLVERRQTLVLKKAVQSTAIVSSLFPEAVRDRLMNTASGSKDANAKNLNAFRDRLNHKPNASGESNNGPHNVDDTIADLFPNCTVFFADIAGFTAWSSTRDPSQVFMLLQNLYQAFDKVASRRKVFKVETIGDSYVAVTGLPQPQGDHALIMAKFARECLLKMEEVTSALEVRLGPDTQDLSMRVGLHSGPVTAGVLKGDRARFQLFGDTVNMAARMESTGARGCIQLSQSTANILISAGKDHWVRPREDVVNVKGKGLVETYWLETLASKNIFSSNQSDRSEVTRSSTGTVGAVDAATTRLVGWMSEVLVDYVKKIVAKNQFTNSGASSGGMSAYSQNPNDICLDELVESFSLPMQNSKEMLTAMEQYRSIELNPKVIEQINRYVSVIASLYHDTNPFHNFSHACHVTMSVHKLMKRVATDGNGEMASSATDGKKKHVATYGILTSDPLTLFAIVFSGLIHDVDHRGVSNMQLSAEEPELAEHYRNKSIAEQNSFDIAWDLLMTTSFADLRKAIFSNVDDLMRFRQVVVNTVLATDIFDKELGDMRKSRWKRIFGKDDNLEDEETLLAQNTRATIVLEHIIQASDVSHTMQHWHVYQKWNRKLFQEMSLAYQQGRMAKDPATFWYKGELGFFDNYVIPLAKKLQECQVFGVSSDEYLNYAKSNRIEWELKGQSIVQELIMSTKRVDIQMDLDNSNRSID